MYKLDLGRVRQQRCGILAVGENQEVEPMRGKDAKPKASLEVIYDEA